MIIKTTMYFPPSVGYTVIEMLTRHRKLMWITYEGLSGPAVDFSVSALVGDTHYTAGCDLLSGCGGIHHPALVGLE